MVVKCNRVKEGEVTHDDEENCKDNVAIGQDRFVVQHAGREKKTGQMLGEEKEVGTWYKGLEDIFFTVLAVSDTYGLVLLLVASFLVLVFLLGYLLHSCCRSKRPHGHTAPSSPLRKVFRRQRQHQPSSAPALSALEEILSLSAAKVFLIIAQKTLHNPAITSRLNIDEF